MTLKTPLKTKQCFHETLYLSNLFAITLRLKKSSKSVLHLKGLGLFLLSMLRFWNLKKKKKGLIWRQLQYRIKKITIMIALLERFIENEDITRSCFGWLKETKNGNFQENFIT